VSERPVALLAHVAYARRGGWTQDLDGLMRSLALAYAYAIAIPISTFGYLLAWSSARPARFATFWVVTTLVVLALAHLSQRPRQTEDVRFGGNQQEVITGRERLPGDRLQLTSSGHRRCVDIVSDHDSGRPADRDTPPGHTAPIATRRGA
jgi:hypothetical protein